MSEIAKNRWIDEMMIGLDGVQRAKAPDGLYQKVLHKINKGRVEVLPARVVWMAAASMLLIISVNVLLLKSAAKHSFNKDQVQALVNDYQLNNNSALYNL